MERLAPLVGRTLVLVAHPDDESISCGALMQRMREPLVVFATDGAPRDAYFWEKFGSREACARTWRILFVAYPMLAVSETACGGAEQMLWTLESEMARRGHVTAVAACDGSRIAGRLIATGGVPEQPDRYDERNAEHQAVILAHLAQTQSSLQPYDLVHDKSGSFWRCAGQADAPVLATLHLPRAMYGGAFRDVPGNVWFNGVSEAQARTLPDLPQLAGMVRNGVRTHSFPPPADRRED